MAGAHRLCALSDLADGCAHLIDVSVGVEGVPRQSLIVIREGDSVRAFDNACPHFGVPLARIQAQLICEPGVSLTCNTHYARFNWLDGRCVSGDCVGESLRAVALTLDEGEVILP